MVPFTIEVLFNAFDERHSIPLIQSLISLGMCRKSDYCTELGTNPTQWSTRTPLPHPEYFEKSLETFIRAFEFAKVQDSSNAISFLSRTRSDELRNWFVEHGQMSGWYHRAKILSHPKNSKSNCKIVKRVSFASYTTEIFTRDGYVCRYCSTKVIDISALKRFEKWVGVDNFRATGRTNEVRHGIALVCRATIDDVVPVSAGGKTQMKNLVTACWGCNYGKSGASLESIGLTDPRKFAIKKLEGWNGLIDTKLPR